MRNTKANMIQNGTNKTDIQSAKLIGNNTLRIIYKDGTEAIRLHLTDIIRIEQNEITFNSGGWHTITTKDRINNYLPSDFPLYLKQKNNIWFFQNGENEIYYYDGIRFSLDGKLLSENKKPEFGKIKIIKNRIKKYLSLVDQCDKIPVPNNGDCFYCLMKETKTEKPLGDCFKDNSHLEMHLEENYLHGSIIYNALKEKGYISPEVIMSMNIKESIKSALRKYLTVRLLPELAR